MGFAALCWIGGSHHASYPNSKEPSWKARSRSLRGYDACLSDMQLAARHVAEHVADPTPEQFLSNRTAQAAVEREISILGEAAANWSAFGLSFFDASKHRAFWVDFAIQRRSSLCSSA
jgi:hypothetical protein